MRHISSASSRQEDSNQASFTERFLSFDEGRLHALDERHAAQPPATSSCCLPLSCCLKLLCGGSKQQLRELENQIKQANDERDQSRKKAEELLQRIKETEKQQEDAEKERRKALEEKEAADKDRSSALEAKEKAEAKAKSIAEGREEDKEALRKQEELTKQTEERYLKAENERSALAERIAQIKKEVDAKQRRSTFCDCWAYMLRVACCCICIPCLPRGERTKNCCATKCLSDGRAGRPASSTAFPQVGSDGIEHPFVADPQSSIELINALIASEWRFISLWFRQQMVELAQPCLQELIGQYISGVKVSIGEKCDLGTQPVQLHNIATKNYKEFLSDSTEIDNVQILGQLDYHSDAQMELNLETFGSEIVKTQVQVSDIIIKGEIVIELVKLTHTPPWFSGVRIFSPNVPNVDLKVNSKLFGMNFNVAWLKKTIIDAITRNVITSFAVLPNRFTINLGDRIDEFALNHPAPQGVLRLAVMEASGLRATGDNAWPSWRAWQSQKVPVANADPKAVVNLGAMTIETRKMDKTLDPFWGLQEIHDLVVTDLEKQKLRIVLRDTESGLFSTKPSDFLGQVEVPVKDLTNCTEKEVFFPLSGIDSTGEGSHGQLGLKAQFRELANIGPHSDYCDNWCSPEMAKFLNFWWDIGEQKRACVLLMADVFYASGLSSCEDGTLHWAELKVSGYRNPEVPEDQCPTIERQTSEIPGRTAVRHGRELVSSLGLGPDLMGVLPSETEEDLARKIWRKRVEVSAKAHEMENSGHQLVDVVFNTPFSFLLDGVAGVTVEISIWRHEKTRRKDGKKCVGRIKKTLSQQFLSQNPRWQDFSSLPDDSLHDAPFEEPLGRLKWRLRACPLLKPKELKVEAKGESSLFPTCFSGMGRRAQQSERIPDANQEQKDEQKPEQSASENTVDQPGARSSWFGYSLFRSSPKENAPAVTESSAEPETDSYAKTPSTDQEETSKPNAGNTTYYSWFFGRSARASTSEPVTTDTLAEDENMAPRKPSFDSGEEGHIEAGEAPEAAHPAVSYPSSSGTWFSRFFQKSSLSSDAAQAAPPISTDQTVPDDAAAPTAEPEQKRSWFSWKASEPKSEPTELKDEQSIAANVPASAEESKALVEEKLPPDPKIKYRRRPSLRKAHSHEDLRVLTDQGSDSVEAGYEDSGYQSDQDGRNKSRRSWLSSGWFGSRQKLVEEPTGELPEIKLVQLVAQVEAAQSQDGKAKARAHSDSKKRGSGDSLANSSWLPERDSAPRLSSAPVFGGEPEMQDAAVANAVSSVSACSFESAEPSRPASRRASRKSVSQPPARGVASDDAHRACYPGSACPPDSAQSSNHIAGSSKASGWFKGMFRRRPSGSPPAPRSKDESGARTPSPTKTKPLTSGHAVSLPASLETYSGQSTFPALPQVQGMPTSEEDEDFNAPFPIFGGKGPP